MSDSKPTDTRKFYRTRYVLDVLSEDPIPPDMEIGSVLLEMEEGDYVGECNQTSEKELDTKQVTRALYKFGSEPGFFGIGEEDEP